MTWKKDHKLIMSDVMIKAKLTWLIVEVSQVAFGPNFLQLPTEMRFIIDLTKNCCRHF